MTSLVGRAKNTITRQGKNLELGDEKRRIALLSDIGPSARTGIPTLKGKKKKGKPGKKGAGVSR